MSAIVGIADGKHVHMAADSEYEDGNRKIRDTRPKLFRVGELLIGASGDLRVALAVHYADWLPPYAGGDEDAYMRLAVLDALRALLKERELLTDEESPSFGLLVGWRGRLWEIDPHFTATAPPAGFAAIGSGGAPAWGALYSRRALALPEALKMALEAAAEYGACVSPPFHFASTDPRVLGDA